jgi:DNA-binding transcriptional regulator YiaG
MKDIKRTVDGLASHTGLSQADIARLLGVPVKTLNAWLSGRVTCRHKTMLSLALEALSARLEVKK